MPQGDRTTIVLRPTHALDLRLIFEVFKLRIGLVIGLTAIAGLAVAPGRSLPAWKVGALALAVTLASAAAGAFNQYVERDLDARMGRTRNRPFVTGRLAAGAAWLVAIVAGGALGVGLAAAALNAAAAAYTFLGAFTYAVVYTILLKRRTCWNIVIGGLAGSFSVLAGAAAVSPQSLGLLPAMLAIVLFLWTPPHFWSLAIAFRDDYAAAKVPMLPVVVGNARAARVVLAGSALLVAVALLPAMFGMGRFYLATAVGAGIYLLVRSVQLARAPTRRTAIANFHASLVYLALLLGAAIADAPVKS
jgi:heme o synthase